LLVILFASDQFYRAFKIDWFFRLLDNTASQLASCFTTGFLLELGFFF